MKIGGSSAGGKWDLHSFPFIGAELFRESHGAEHRPIHSGMTYKVELGYPSSRRFDMVKDLKQVPLAFDRL